MSSSSSASADDQREALLETLRGYKVRTAPSQLFPGECGVVAIAPIAKGESVFPCNGELSNDVINLTFEDVASLPSHSRKLVWAFFQPNQDPRTIPREELTFPIPVNGLVHAGNSFFCNSADGTGQDANVETGTVIDGSGYAELIATRDIQVGEELLDSYPIWDYGGSGEFLSTMVGEVDAVEFLGFGISDDEAREILDLRHHMASLKAKVARLEQLKEINQGQITGLKRQVDSTSSDNRELKTKMARFERAMADLKHAHEREVADLERQAAASASNSRLWWGYVNRTYSANTCSYRDTSTTDSQSEDDDSVAGGIANGAADHANTPNVNVDVDVSTLCLDEEAISGDDSNSTNSSSIANDRLCKQKEAPDNDGIGIGIGIIEDASEETNQDDGDDNFPPPPPLPGQVVEAGNLLNASPARWGNDERWNKMLGELREYKEENGDCNVPQRQGPLGDWVMKQRRYHRKREVGLQTSLTDERIADLDAMGFEWDGSEAKRTANTKDDRWYERLGELREHKEENGHCNVPRSQGKLGTWVTEQRRLHRKREKGEQTALTDERVSALDAIGFEWNGACKNKHGGRNDELWVQRLGELRDYQGENGHCNVPNRHGPLGEWVKVQRSLYRKREKGEQTPLTDQRVAALNAMGFEWDGTAAANGGKSNDELWHEWLGKLRDYKEENGHCNVPMSEGRLGNWVRDQRKYYRKRADGKPTPLTDEHLAALNAIGFEWDGTGVNTGRSNDELWNNRLDELQDYKNQKGHCNVPQSQGPLGRWVAGQRSEYRKREKGEQTPLTDKRVAALDAFGFEWDGAGANNVSNDGRWYERLGELREYREENGHCNVPKSQGPLGEWVNKQRYLHRQKNGGKPTPLTDDRVAALEALDFKWVRYSK